MNNYKHILGVLDTGQVTVWEVIKYISGTILGAIICNKKNRIPE